MTRRCSHCSQNGHNSRTCPNRGVKIFGVRLTDGSIRKSVSMGNLSHYVGGGGGSGTPQNGPFVESPADTPDHPSATSAAADGYGSEDFVGGSSSSRERKKGTPWMEEEHRMFLLGLQKLGKGDWRGISRNYVISRTPTQVASHAQKYFIRQSNISRRKRRSSLFDIVPDESIDTPIVSRDFFAVKSPQPEPQSSIQAPLAIEDESESMNPANSNNCNTTMLQNHMIYPAYVTPIFPLSIPVWPGEPMKEETHQIVKPTAIHSKKPIFVDQLVDISQLNLGQSLADSCPLNISLTLAQGSTRPSAFHANPASDNTNMNNTSHNPIPAV